MADERRVKAKLSGERAEAWTRSDLNQRQYCEAEGIPLKAFGNCDSSLEQSHNSRTSSPIIPRPREGHRRRFDEADKRRILDEAARPGASVSEVARRYGIDRRILCRWKQELSSPAFVTVEISDVVPNGERRACSLQT